MPGLVRKVLIFAAIDGLVLQPAPPRNHRPATEQAIKIAYRSNAIAPLLKDRRDEETAPPAFEAHGIIGLLTISSMSYLISISDRQQVAQIRGRSIYVVQDVALIPLSSRQDAEAALEQARNSRLKRVRPELGIDEESSDSEEEDTRTLTEVDSLPDNSTNVDDEGKHHKRNTSVVEDVINRKGLYGRFADRWFSRKGWDAEGRKKQGMSSNEHLEAAEMQSLQAGKATGTDTGDAATTKPQDKGDQKYEPSISTSEDDAAAQHAEKQTQNPPQHYTMSLLPRILRTAEVFFASKSFFFSYDYDLSRSLSLQHPGGQGNNLHNSFDPLYFWNAHLIKLFNDAGQQSFAMPVIQGFVGQRAFALDSTETSRRGSIVEARSNVEEVLEIQGNEDEQNPLPDVKAGQRQFLLTIISRRSTKRAGLRYLRRGVDEHGNAANSVETEQILSTSAWGDDGSGIYSYLQVRGSIPLFFSQSPYSFKPVPVFSGSEDTNASAFKLHFQKMARRYGNIQGVSLVDKHGTEMAIGEAYEKQAANLNEHGGIDGKGTQLKFEWFDFHRVCAGMKFQNVSILMDSIRPALQDSGWTVEQGGAFKKRQGGILRTNCMDCLDRTNVVQSAAGRNALEQQLAEQGFTIDLQTDPTTAWFNSVWADNGDAISRQYAGTAALKGDFTRTRTRKISGALTDFGLTLTRYYNNIVNDYLAQIFIDYALGNANATIFVEFEADMKAQDYAVDLHKVRQRAIDTCTKIVIEDPSEDILAGWTLSCPRVGNTLRTLPFEECVLLLTEASIYFCRFDWGTEKIREFERVELECLQTVMKGVYITSTLNKRDVDNKKNVGFVISYRSDGRGMRRINTRSLASSESEGVRGEEAQSKPRNPADVVDTQKYLAFKILPPRSSVAAMEGQETRTLEEEEMVDLICDQLARVANQAREKETVPDRKKVEVEEGEIISLAQARKTTGYLEQIGYSLKKLVWA